MHQQEEGSVPEDQKCHPSSQVEAVPEHGSALLDPAAPQASQAATHVGDPEACSPGLAPNGNGVRDKEPDAQPAHARASCSSSGSDRVARLEQQRPESTGLLPSIPEPCGSHLYFDSDGEEPPQLEDSAVIAQLCFGEDAAGQLVISLPYREPAAAEGDASTGAAVSSSSSSVPGQAPAGQASRQSSGPQKKWCAHWQIH